MDTTENTTTPLDNPYIPILNKLTKLINGPTVIDDDCLRNFKEYLKSYKHLLKIHKLLINSELLIAKFNTIPTSDLIKCIQIYQESIFWSDISNEIFEILDLIIEIDQHRREEFITNMKRVFNDYKCEDTSIDDIEIIIYLQVVNRLNKSQRNLFEEYTSIFLESCIILNINRQVQIYGILCLKSIWNYEVNLKNKPNVISDLSNQIIEFIDSKTEQCQVLFCYFIDYFTQEPELTLFTDSNIWDALKKGVLSNENLSRKISMFLLRTLTVKLTNSTKLYGKGIPLKNDAHNTEIWNLYFTICDNLNENHSHLIIPTLPQSMDRISCSPLHLDWIWILLIKCLLHYNKTVQEYAVHLIIDNELMLLNPIKINYWLFIELFETFINILNNTYLFENLDKKPLNLEKLTKVVLLDLDICLEIIKSKQWKSIPFWYIIELFDKFIMEKLSDNQLRIAIDTLINRIDMIPNKAIRHQMKLKIFDSIKRFLLLEDKLSRIDVLRYLTILNLNLNLIEDGYFKDEFNTASTIFDSTNISDKVKAMYCGKLRQSVVRAIYLKVVNNFEYEKLTLFQYAIRHLDNLSTEKGNILENLFRFYQCSPTNQRLSDLDIIRLKAFLLNIYKLEILSMRNSGRSYNILYEIIDRFEDKPHLAPTLLNILNYAIDVDPTIIIEFWKATYFYTTFFETLRRNGYEEDLSKSLLSKRVLSGCAENIEIDENKVIEISTDPQHYLSLKSDFKELNYSKWNIDLNEIETFLASITDGANAYRDCKENYNRLIPLIKEINGLIGVIIDNLFLLKDDVRYSQIISEILEENIDFAYEALISGEIITNEKRMEIELFLKICPNQAKKESISSIRWKMLILLRKSSKQFRSTLIKFLLQKSAELNTKKPRYFLNSLQHCYKLRIVQAIAMLNYYNPEWDQNYLHGILLENNQLNINYILEIIVATTIVPEDIFNILSTATTNSARQSLFIIMFYLCCNRPVTAEYRRLCIEKIIPWTMGQHFGTRLYAQIVIVKLIERFQLFVQFDLIYKTIQYAVKHCKVQNQALDNMLNDFRLKNLDYKYLNHYTYFLYEIPLLTKMPIEERFYQSHLYGIEGDCISQSQSVKSLIDKLMFVHTLSTNYLLVGETKIDDENVCSNGTSIDNIQRKINTNDLLTEIGSFKQNDGFDRNNESDGMILVACLVTRIPNLGGLARSCEIFGVKNFVINSLKSMDSNEFRALSMTSEKWLPISEVKSWQLEDYLLSMKRLGYIIIGAEQTSKSVSLDHFKIPKKTILLLGHEKEGIPAKLLTILDFTVEIPQFGVVRSLNVHVSGALFLWEYAKQHYVNKIC